MTIQPKEYHLASTRALRAFIRTQKTYMRFQIPVLVSEDTLKMEVGRSQIHAFLNKHYEDDDPSPWHVSDVRNGVVFFDIY